MSKKQHGFSHPVMSTTIVNPFVLLFAASLMIAAGQYQISISSPAHTIKPLGATAALSQEKKTENLVKPLMLEAAKRYSVKPVTIKSVIAAYPGDSDVRYFGTLMSWFDWDVERGRAVYNTGRSHLRNSIMDRYQISQLQRAPIGINPLGCAIEHLDQQAISLDHVEPKTNKTTSDSLTSPLTKKINLKPSIAGILSCLRKNAENRFQPIILKAAQRHDVDPAIIKAIIMAESGFNPKAVSNKGARGLMQLMPRTAKYLGVKDSFNPEHNINGGVRYFKVLLDRFDCDVKLALAAYNAGSRNVKKYDGVPPFNATKCYIKKVLTYYETYKGESEMPQIRSFYLI